MIMKIIKKEVRELFKKSTLIAMIIIAFMFGYLGKTLSSAGKEINDDPKIVLINEDNDYYSNIYANQIKSMGSVADASDAEVNTITIPEGFSDSITKGVKAPVHIHYYMKGAAIMNSIETEIFERLLSVSATGISDSLIKNKMDIAPSVIRDPIQIINITTIKGKTFDNMSPGYIMSQLGTQVSTLPVLIMMLIIMSGSTVISSMAFEKENKTLETLLTMPVKRSYIISGKIIGSAIVGLVFAGIYIIGFRYYMNSLSFGESVMSSFSMSLTVQEWILLLLSFLSSLLAGLGACMLLGAFTKDSKTSQTMIFPITISAMFSMFMTMFIDFSTMAPALKVIYFIIPFSHPMMAFRELLFGNYMLVVSGIVYCFVFFFIMIGITARIFSSDILLIGLPEKFKLTKYLKSR